ncbi:MAG: exodeoxyribonuclease III [Alphaproteobacteria bacterium]|nr:exodeoxyribonuclease III [Alphaproteobacteria bacterium]
MQKIISWNVASVRARLPVLVDFLSREKPDYMLLQEIKATEENFPFFDLQMAGYTSVISGQKSYNGVAILSRWPLQFVRLELAGFADQARFIQAETKSGVVLICVYVPNGNPPDKNPTDMERLTYKLRWMAALGDHIQNLICSGKEVVLGGDFNVIERDSDVYQPDLFRESALMIPPVRQAYADLTKGLINVIRQYNAAENSYSFWDFQGGAWPKNNGILLDALWVTPALARHIVRADIYKSVRGIKGTSDHVPVGLTTTDLL